MTVMTTLCPLSLQTLQEDGKPLIGAKIYIFETETTTPKTVFKDFQGQISHPRPILTNAQGRVPPIYIGTGIYRVRILKPNNTPFEDVDGLVGASVPDGGESPGGETYPLTDENSVMKTGDVIWSYRTGPRVGFTPCNGGTIGQETSGATNIAVGVPSNQTQPAGSAFSLFRFLWENDSHLPVYASGVAVQRGSTALSDWDSNRTLGVPDLRGRTTFGLDNMGALGAGVAQIVANMTTSAGVATATVSSKYGLCVGMYVNLVGVPEGTKIVFINGLNVTLSALPTISMTQAQARFSMFPDAQKLGSIGGVATHTLDPWELAPHNHVAVSTSEDAGSHIHTGYTDTQGWHQHTCHSIYVDAGSGIAAGAGLGNRELSRPSDGAGNHTHTVYTRAAGIHKHVITTTIAETGGGNAHNNTPPAVLGTFYMKI